MRHNRALPIILTLIGCLVATQATCQIRISRVGVVSSLKDMGITLQTVKSGSTGFNSYSLLFNMYGVISGNETWPGIKLHWCHQEILASKEFRDCHCFLYLGGGACGGYVRDFSSLQHPNPGIMASMTADAGVLLRYRSDIDIAIDFSAEMGLHLRRDETFEKRMNLSWYANGLLNCWMPSLTIYYKF